MEHQEITGFYCLANDKVLDWMIAFLESLRFYEPDRRLIIIPFDKNIDKLAKLSQKYKFEFLHDESLEELDNIGSRFAEKPSNRMFRKLATFWGPLDHFLYLDSDIVVLSNLEELFEGYFRSGSDFMYSGTKSFINMKAVYKPGAFRDEMIRDYSAKGFNAGAFLSSKNLLKLDEIRKISDEALLIKDNFANYGDQPFFNYCIDIKRLNTKGFADIVPDLCITTWAQYEPIKMSDNVYRLMAPDRPDFGKRIPFIHWAGKKINPYMPNRKIFLDYRLKGISWLSRFRYRYISLYDWWKRKMAK